MISALLNILGVALGGFVMALAPVGMKVVPATGSR